MTEVEAGSGFERAWESRDGVATIFHEPEHNQIVIDTFNHRSEAALLSPDEARSAAAALLVFADQAEA